MPLIDPDIPVPRRQEDFPLTGEEEGDDGDEEDEGNDEDEGDDEDGDDEDEDCEPDSADQESLQDIPIEPETARIEEMEMCRATIASQHDHIVTLER